MIRTGRMSSCHIRSYTRNDGGQRRRKLVAGERALVACPRLYIAWRYHKVLLQGGLHSLSYACLSQVSVGKTYLRLLTSVCEDMLAL